MDILVDFWNVTAVVFLGLSGVAGLLALISPSAFAAAGSCGNWTVFHGVQARVDQRRVDVDTFVFAHGRLFGLLVVATVAVDAGECQDWEERVLMGRHARFKMVYEFLATTARFGDTGQVVDIAQLR